MNLGTYSSTFSSIVFCNRLNRHVQVMGQVRDADAWRVRYTNGYGYFHAYMTGEEMSYAQNRIRWTLKW